MVGRVIIGRVIRILVVGGLVVSVVVVVIFVVSNGVVIVFDKVGWLKLVIVSDLISVVIDVVIFGLLLSKPFCHILRYIFLTTLFFLSFTWPKGHIIHVTHRS